MTLPKFQAGLVLLAASAAAQTPAPHFDLAAGRQFLKTNCAACHGGKPAAGGFDINKLTLPESFRERSEQWSKAALRVHNGEMPPKSAVALEQREAFAAWVRENLKTAACADGVVPGRAPVRRLSRSQYTATVRDLLNLHVDIGSVLPADSAGGEGFDNAAETLFLSPIYAEKYLDAAKLALNYAVKDPRARAKFLVAAPGPGVAPEAAARTILEEFLPRAFRRPVEKADLDFYLGLYSAAAKRGESFEDSILYSLRAVLISPQFLFRMEPPNTSGQTRPLDDYSLASRLSYFLWGSEPDGLLLALAEEGKLNDPEVLKGQVARMLRNQRAVDFARSFVDQWLHIRDLGAGFQPDPQLFPQWNDSELQGDIKNQPVLFFREIVANDLSILDFLDSKWTIATRKLQKVLYGTNIKPARPNNQEQPQRIELPEGSDRGGLLGMSAVLMISSHPHRTSPVLRGKWLLETILGTPPPPPPPGVPKLEEAKTGAAPATLRERLAQHRENPACATCHSRIDPLGFALENYDVLGRWRTEDAGKPIDAKGELPDGTAFEGPGQLKAALMARKDLFVRNFTTKMLGYALGRGLTLQDSCTVDSIVAEVERNDYRAQALINAVVMSVPFRFQGVPAAAPKQAPRSLAQAQQEKKNP
jgi:mono/diheme cytochrome c family protein